MWGVWVGTGALLAMIVDDAVEFVSVGKVDIGRVDVGIVGLAGTVDVCVDTVGVDSVAVGVVGAPNNEFKAFVNTTTGAGAVEMGAVDD